MNVLNKVLWTFFLALIGCLFVCMPLVACGDDSGSAVDSGDGGKEESQYALKNLTGFASFISKNTYEKIKSGSEKYEVTLFELDSGANLTNREFITDGRQGFKCFHV